MAIKDLITRDTNVIHIFAENYDIKLLSRQTGISEEILEYNDSWYRHNGTWYYFKRFYNFYKEFPMEMKFINELIGETLAKSLELPVVHYEIAQRNDIIGLMSENFVQKEKQYLFMKELKILTQFYDDSNLIRIKKVCLDDKNYKELLSELLKMVALDLYSGQEDRNLTNIQFTRNDGELHLAPVYDFEDSFREPFQYDYYSAFVNMPLSAIEYHPGLKKYLEMLFKVKMLTVLEQIEDERKLIIPPVIKEKYNSFEKERRKVLKY